MSCVSVNIFMIRRYSINFKKHTKSSHLTKYITISYSKNRKRTDLILETFKTHVRKYPSHEIVRFQSACSCAGLGKNWVHTHIRCDNRSLFLQWNPPPPPHPLSKQQHKASTRAKNAPLPRNFYNHLSHTWLSKNVLYSRVIVESICWRVCVNWREQQKHPLLRGGGGGVGRAPLASPRTLRAPGSLSDDRISYQKPSIQLIYTRENWLLLVLSNDIDFFFFTNADIFIPLLYFPPFSIFSVRDLFRSLIPPSPSIPSNCRCDSDTASCLWTN